MDLEEFLGHTLAVVDSSIMDRVCAHYYPSFFVLNEDDNVSIYGLQVLPVTTKLREASVTQIVEMAFSEGCKPALLGLSALFADEDGKLMIISAIGNPQGDVVFGITLLARDSDNTLSVTNHFKSTKEQHVGPATKNLTEMIAMFFRLFEQRRKQ